MKETVTTKELLKVMSLEEYRRLDDIGVLRQWDSMEGISLATVPTYYRAILALSDLSETTSALQTDQIAEQVSLLEQQRKALLLLVCQLLQDSPGYMLHPSRLAVESVGDLSVLSDEQIIFLSKRMAQGRPSHLSIGNTYVPRKHYCLRNFRKGLSCFYARLVSAHKAESDQSCSL